MSNDMLAGVFFGMGGMIFIILAGHLLAEIFGGEDE